MVKQVTTKQIIHSYLNTDILSVHRLIFFQRYQLAPRERREASAHAHALIVLVLSFKRIVTSMVGNGRPLMPSLVGLCFRS